MQNRVVIATDIVFIFVLSCSGLCLISETSDVLHFDKTTGKVLVYILFFGVPISFVVSLFSLLRFNLTRYKFYTIVNSILLLTDLILIWIIYNSKI